MGDSDAKTPEDEGPGAPAPDPADAPAPAPARRSLLRDPWFRFASLFGLLALSCEVLYYALLVDSDPLQYYLGALAFMAGQILGGLGLEAEVTHTLITSGGFAVQVAHGCDAIQICALYSCSVLAFPAPIRRKFRGLVIGIVWLQLLNQLRIVSLVVIGRFYGSHFETAHYSVWPTFLIVVTVGSWIVWVRWATRRVERDAG